MVLNPGVRLETAQNMIIRAGDRAGGKYSFIFGPYLVEPKASFDDPDLVAKGGVAPSFGSRKKKKLSELGAGTPASTMAVFSTSTAVAVPAGQPMADEEDVEVFEVQSGMSLFWGTQPKVKSKRTYIGGDGTKFLLYVEPPAHPTDPSVEHIVLVDPTNSDQARVYHLVDGQPVGDPVIIRTGHLYVRVNLDGTFTEGNMPPPDIQAIVDYAKQQAQAAGVWP